MNVERKADLLVSEIAAAIGEEARVRILYSLLDGRARTSTELAVVADVSPSTTSAHLNRLKAARLIKVFVQGKHRYYSLERPDVADALEGLMVLAGCRREKFVPNTPSRLRLARTCYDHMAGTVGVLLHNRFHALGWLCGDSNRKGDSYQLTPVGADAVTSLGIDLVTARSLRRRFAFPCLDWSERQPHIGGALGTVLLKTAIKRKWMLQDLDSRVLTVTGLGRREMLARFGVHVPDSRS